MKRIFFVFFVFFFATIETRAQSHNESEFISSSTINSGWDVAILEETGKILNTSNYTRNARSIDLVANDSRLYVYARSTQNVVSYELETPGDISSAVFVNEFDTSPYLGTKSQSSVGHGFYIERDYLERMWLWNRTEVWQFDLSSGDISTATKSGYKDLSNYVTRGHDIDFRPDGKVFYVEDRVQETVHQFSLSEPWNIETLNWEYTLDISSRHSAVRGIEFDPTGKIMFLLDTSLQEIQQYKLDEAWEISTATFEKATPISFSNPRGLTWNENGTSAYVMNASNGRITQYDMISLPDLVQLSSPYNEKNNVSIPVNLKWEAFYNAEYYDVQISVSQDFNDIIVETGSDTTSLSTTVLTDATIYFWRVRGTVDEQKTAWSEVWSFETELRIPDIPSLSLGDGEENIATKPLLEWNASNRAEYYDLQLTDNISFEDLVIDIQQINETQIQVGNELEGNTTYNWRVRAGNEAGYSDWSEILQFTTEMTTSTELADLPKEFSLEQNYPNPFNPTTTVTFMVPESSHVTVEVFNVVGQRVSELVNGQLNGGVHKLTFDASSLSSGIYLIRMRTSEHIFTRKMTLVK